MSEDGQSWAARVSISTTAAHRTQCTHTHICICTVGLLICADSVTQWETPTPDPIYKAGLISPKERGWSDNWSGRPGNGQLIGEMMKSLWSNFLPLAHADTHFHTLSHTVQMFHNQRYINRTTLCCWRCSHDAQFEHSSYNRDTFPL